MTNIDICSPKNTKNINDGFGSTVDRYGNRTVIRLIERQIIAARQILPRSDFKIIGQRLYPIKED